MVPSATSRREVRIIPRPDHLPANQEQQYAGESLGALIKEQPDDDPEDVTFSQIYGLRTIELNRPKKLNSLNGSMARKIIGRLKVETRPVYLNLSLTIKRNGKSPN